MVSRFESEFEEVEKEDFFPNEDAAALRAVMEKRALRFETAEIRRKKIAFATIVALRANAQDVAGLDSSQRYEMAASWVCEILGWLFPELCD